MPVDTVTDEELPPTTTMRKRQCNRTKRLLDKISRCVLIKKELGSEKDESDEGEEEGSDWGICDSKESLEDV